MREKICELVHRFSVKYSHFQEREATEVQALRVESDYV
jgi:hypothetical protein